MSAFTAGTYSPKQAEVVRDWCLIDAKNMVLGRLASEIAKILRGKHKPRFTPYMNFGDNVIVINAEKIALTGKKLEQKIFYWHTNHPGGIKERSVKKILGGRFPSRVLEKAVERMMPKDSALARDQMKCLHVYAGESHLHEAQKPVLLDLASRNRKNTRV
jgi:large subunit ribosomal protein L13